MSVVSSVLSTRSTGWRINVRFSSLMDSIFAIGFGLGLRFVVDTVSHHDFKLTGTLVGLWEGVIMLHFLKKMPKSSDPYIAYGVRLFIDLLFTESLARMVLVLIWTALGMVLADITPAIWDDVGLKRIWKSFRRDLYTISRMIPTVAFFPPARTVRFSPSREPSIIVEPTEVLSPSDITNEETPLPNIDPPFAPVSRDASKRRLPGYFSLDYSDTDTDAGSVRIDEYTAPGRTSRRLSVYPQRRDSDDSTSELSLGQDELDEANISSFPSDATETGGPQSALPDASEIPDMQVEEEPLFVNTAELPVKPEDGEVTPTQRQHIFMPPTPSDSAPHWGRKRDVEEPLPVRPPSEFLPQIPDFLEEATTEEWEKIEYEKPPTPPAKDKPVGFKIPKVPGIPPPEPPTAEQSHPAPMEEEGWDTLESQFLSPPPPQGNPATEQPIDNNTTRRQTLPPSYEDVDFDDIYEDPLLKNTANDILTGNLIDSDPDLPPAHVQQADAGAGSLPPLSGLDVSLVNPWDMVTSDSQDVTGGSNEAEEAARAAAAAEAARLQEEEEQKRVAEKAAQAERVRQQEEEEAEKRKQEEATKEKERKAEEKKAKKEADKAEMAKKELEDDIARKNRVAEAEEAEKKKMEQIKKDAEDAQLRREEAAKKRAEKEAEKKRKEEEEEKRRKEEEQKLEEKRLKEQEEQELKDEADKKAQEEEKLKEEEKSKQEEEKPKAEPGAQNALEADQTITNGNGDVNKETPEQTQGDAAPTEEQLQEQLTPTMSTRKLDEPHQAAVDTQEPDAVDEQSVISVGAPPDPEFRVGRMLSLRAQMVDTQIKIEEMKSAGSDCSGLEKVLRKMVRQAQRRYAAGTPLAEYLNDFDDANSVNLDILNPQKSKRKVAEKIEQLLTPTSQELFLNINFGKKGNNSKIQKPAITELLEEYNLLKYAREVGKKTTINVPEKSFADWVTGYRILSTQEKDDGRSALWR